MMELCVIDGNVYFRGDDLTPGEWLAMHEQQTQS
jgi:hypothetical protein